MAVATGRCFADAFANIIIAHPVKSVLIALYLTVVFWMWGTLEPLYSYYASADLDGSKHGWLVTIVIVGDAETR